MIALDLIAAHMVGDFLLQGSAMADEKLRDWRIRLLHVAIYSLPFVVVMIGEDVRPARAAIFLAANFALHFLIDSRRWASAREWPPKPILVDQTLHMVTLAVLAHLL
jgi:hypothetical protein